MKCKNTIAMVLAGAMLLPTNAFAADLSKYKDFPNDWSAKALEQAIDDGLLNGSNGMIDAKGLLTRAQMAAIVSRAFGATKTASLSSYRDVLPSAWYYSDMGKAVKMGAFQGSNGLLNPDAPITREEAFTVLARAFALEGGNSAVLKDFVDGGTVSSWASESVAALVANGYVNGSNGMLNLKNNITRAEFAKVITGMAASYVGAESVSGKTVDGNVIVRESGASLSGMTINGDLIIADSADKVSLDGVTVTGRIVIRGGADSVSMKDTKASKGVLVSSPNGAAAISVSGGSVGTVTAKSDLAVTGGSADKVVLEDGASLSVSKGASVGTVTVSGDGSKVSGEGTVTSVQANANNVTVSTKNTKVTAASGVSGVKAGDKTVEAGKTETVGSNTSSGGSSGGGGSSQSQYTYVLMNIPYDEFYKAEIKNDKSVDAVSSATKTKSVKFAGSYYEEREDGVDIKGVKFPVRVLRSDLNSLSLDGLTAASDYYYSTEDATPAVYKELTIENGVKTFSEIKGTTEAMTADVALSTDTPWGDYLAEITQDGNQVDFGTVYAIVVKTSDGTSYGMRHLENIWLKNYEFAWSTGLKTSEPHGNTLNGAQYASMMGKTITEIDVVTNSGIKTIATETYVPVKFENSFEVSNALTSAMTADVTLTGLPEDYKAKYTVKDASGEEQTGFTVENGKLIWTGTPAIGAYTLTVSDEDGKYASYSASFELQTDAMPAQAGDLAITVADDANDADFAAYVKAIKSVKIGETTYSASGRGAVQIFNENGGIDLTAKPFADMKSGATYTFEVQATGYSKPLTFTVTIPDYIYTYASVPYDEYWKSEGVYLEEGSAWDASSDVADARGEMDKGAFDAVSRATTLHGRHRGSFQQNVVIDTTDNNKYTPVYWIGSDTAVVSTGKEVTLDKTNIKDYKIYGIKYVPVKVAASDFAAFSKKYTVTQNGETLSGGYTENNLNAYSDLVAEVKDDTNGLKEVTKNGDSFSFGARKTGSGSGIKNVAQKSADSDIVVTARDYADAKNFGAHLRVDLTNPKTEGTDKDGKPTQVDAKNAYGPLGDNMQTVVWKYYGNGNTVLATYGTKFAADDWMHKSMGIQLGLTDSKRFKLPEGTDGTGRWEITIYALGYSDSTFTVDMTEDNIAEKIVLMTDAQKAKLEELKKTGEALIASAANADKLTDAESILNEHITEDIPDMLAKTDATESEAADLISEVEGYIKAVQDQRDNQAANGTKTKTLAIIQDQNVVGSKKVYGGGNYDITVTVTLSDGKITNVSATSTADEDDAEYFEKLTDETFYKNFKGISATDTSAIDKIDAVSKATYSSATVKQAVKNALNN